MATIQIDFDQVMQFGDRHGDIGRGLESHRGVFRQDSARLDQIIDTFGLHRSTSNAAFQGMSIASAMGDADARAGRVARSLVDTSSRIFRYAGSFQDDHFNWAGAAFGAVTTVLSGPFGMSLLESVGDELAGKAAEGVLFGARLSPALGSLMPMFAGVTGMLSTVDGFMTLTDPARDGWATMSGALKLVAGGLGLAVGVVGTGLIIALGVAAAPAVAVAAAPLLVIGSVASFGALLIDEREAVGALLGQTARNVVNLVNGIEETATEVAHNLLAGAAQLWNNVVGLAGSMVNVVEDLAFSATEGVHTALIAIGLGGVLNLTPAVATPGGTIPLPGATLLPGGRIQGSSLPNLQRPKQTPTAPMAPPAHGLLFGTHRSWQEVQAAYDANYIGYGLWTDGGPTGQNRYQCVSWAWYRMRELGFTGKQIRANGGELAGRLGGTKETVPRPGAVLSSSGHVMIAEEVTRLSDGRLQVRISEMNSGVHAVDRSKAPDYTTDGTFITASADEYRSDRVITQDGKGGWHYYDRSEEIVIYNPDYP